MSHGWRWRISWQVKTGQGMRKAEEFERDTSMIADSQSLSGGTLTAAATSAALSASPTVALLFFSFTPFFLGSTLFLFNPSIPLLCFLSPAFFVFGSLCVLISKHPMCHCKAWKHITYSYLVAPNPEERLPGYGWEDLPSKWTAIQMRHHKAPPLEQPEIWQGRSWRFVDAQSRTLFWSSRQAWNSLRSR